MLEINVTDLATLASLIARRQTVAMHFVHFLFIFDRSCRLTTTTSRSMTSLPSSLTSSVTAYWATSCVRRPCLDISLTIDDALKNSMLWSVHCLFVCALILNALRPTASLSNTKCLSEHCTSFKKWNAFWTQKCIWNMKNVFQIDKIHTNCILITKYKLLLVS